MDMVAKEQVTDCRGRCQSESRHSNSEKFFARPGRSIRTGS